MTDHRSRTEQELREEIARLNQRIKALEKSEIRLKQTEEALTKNEELFRKAFHTNQDSINITRVTDGRYVSINEGFTKMLGYTEEEVIGKTSIELNIWANLEDRRKLVDATRAQGEVRNREVKYRRKDGVILCALTSASLIELDGVPHTLNVTRDITGRKRAEAEKAALESRLLQAQKMESIGTLAGGIAHDFNNLLMGIQGYVSLMLLNLDPTHPHYERLKRIERQVASGADLTKQLLGFARGGRYEVKPTNMNDIVRKTASMFGRTKKEITIHRTLERALWITDVDQGQLEQVLMNLYVNAWQAMPGGGELHLKTENVVLGKDHPAPYAFKPGQYVKLSITDTGKGMDEETLARIFDPFFTTKSMGEGRGTGLGLAMVYGIVKGHEGMIDVFSEPGRGTTFHLYLPVSDKPVLKEKAAETEIAIGPETILLVDDEQPVIEVTRELLLSLGYRVYAAGSGQEAIAVYQEKGQEIDMAILDMTMPGMTGGETFDRLRKIDPTLKVLLASGYSIEGQAQEILDRGCNGFLQKPFRREALSRKLREILTGADGRHRPHG
ncbi:MAG: response regulator [Deltaproteobacteria bacterium]|nr:response regulator [Deltaproteobacteria bacterium]